MKSKFFLLIFLLFTTYIYSQDNDALAKTYFINAEEYFNRSSLGGYDSCVAELEKAEKALGTINPKILYLKIKAMSQFVAPYHDYYYAYDLNKGLQKFFEITDSKNYAQDKYSEIVNINDDFRSLLRNPKILGDSAYRYSDSSLFYRGFNYENHINSTNDLLQFAEACYRKSAKYGYVKAMLALGRLNWKKVDEYYNKNEYGGIYASQRFKNAVSEAKYWYEKAADKGAYEGWEEIGSMLYVYVEDYPTALKYLSLAADKNNGNACYWLGEIYHKGIYRQDLIRIDKDYKKAFEYYLKVISDPKSSSIPVAMNKISYMYEHGEGVKKDKTLAKEWAQKAEMAKSNR